MGKLLIVMLGSCVNGAGGRLRDTRLVVIDHGTFSPEAIAFGDYYGFRLYFFGFAEST
jgi:hypothetical protein